MKEPFTTSDTSLAAYLHYHDHTVLGYMRDPHATWRMIYVIVKQDDTDKYHSEYDTNSITISPKGYYKSIRAMHQILKFGKEIKK